MMFQNFPFFLGIWIRSMEGIFLWMSTFFYHTWKHAAVPPSPMFRRVLQTSHLWRNTGTAMAGTRNKNPAVLLVDTLYNTTTTGTAA